MSEGRIRFTVEDVGTEWVEVEIVDQPLQFYITRVRAIILSGSGTQVALQVREASEPSSTNDIPIEYALASDWDSLEPFLGIESVPNPSLESATGKMWIAVKVDSGSDSVIDVLVQYERKRYA